MFVIVIIHNDNDDDITQEEMLYLTSSKSKALVRPCIAHEATGVFILNVRFIFLSKILIFDVML